VADIDRAPTRATDFTVPHILGERIRQWFGAEGERWIGALPAKVAALAQRWDLSVRTDSPFTNGFVSWAAPALRRGDGAPAVLKIPYPDRESLHEATALREYAGEGAVRLYEHDPQTGAMLLERLTPGTPVADLAPEDGIGIACALLRRLRRAVPPGHPYILVRDEAARWAGRFETAAREGHALLPRPIAGHAAAVARQFAAEDGATLVNRDPNLGNFLRAEREPWLLIDPKPLVGDPAFDSGHLLVDTLRTDPSPRRTTDFAARIADGLGVDRDRVRRWTLVRAAENCLWQTGEYAAACLAMAGHLTGL
jgi:streptomycin 6-kinase